MKTKTRERNFVALLAGVAWLSFLASRGTIQPLTQMLRVENAATFDNVKRIEKTQHHQPLDSEEFWGLQRHGNLSTTTTEKFPSENSWLLSSKVEREDAGSIPKIIHKTYFQKMGGFQEPSRFNQTQQQALLSWTERNPSYHMQFFDLTSSRSYLTEYFHPVFLRAFDCIESFAAKSDFFRYAVLYREGGWYSDWKQVCLQDGLLDRLAANHSIFLFWDKGHDGVIHDKCISNAFTGAIPRHPILAEHLRLILRNTQSSYYGKTPIHNTGPCLLGQAYQNAKNRTSLEKVGFGGFGAPEGMRFFYQNDTIVQHKCNGCGDSQDWVAGNNYNHLHQRKMFYCQDAASIFLPHEAEYLR